MLIQLASRPQIATKPRRLAYGIRIFPLLDYPCHDGFSRGYYANQGGTFRSTRLMTGTSPSR